MAGARADLRADLAGVERRSILIGVAAAGLLFLALRLSG